MARKKNKKAKPAKEQQTGRDTAEAETPGPGTQVLRPLHIVLLVVLIAVLYANTLNSPFVWDEEPLITNNPFVHSLEFFLHPGRAIGLPNYDALVGRYVTYLSFALNYAISGTSVTGYHAVNITIHAINSVLVYLLVLELLQTPFLRESGLFKMSRSIGLLSGSLFAAHPLMTEAVTYTFQRHASLAATFCIMTIVLYSASRNRGNRAFYIASIISAALAMKTKENAFTIPLVAALYEFMFFRGIAIKRLLRLLPMLLTMGIVPLTLHYLGSLKSGAAAAGDKPAAAGEYILGRMEYFYTQMPVVAKYLGMLIFPLGQNLDHAFSRYNSPLSLPVMTSGLLHLLIISTALFLLRKSAHKRPEQRIIAFGILWFYITLSVESTFMPLQMIITEYRVYLPATGIFLAFSAACTMAARELEKHRPGTLINARYAAITLIIILGTLAFARNSTWETELSIWQDAAMKNPGSARPALHVGYAYEKLGDFDSALKEYQRAAELEPGHQMAHYDIGVIYNNKGQYDKAEAAFRRALDIQPGYALARNNLATVLMRTGRVAEAEVELKRSIELSPRDPNPYFNLSLLLLNAQRYAEAEPYLMELSRLMPGNADIINKLAVVYRQTGRTDKARGTLREGLRSFPGNYHLLLNLASMEDKAGNTSEAEKLFISALGVIPVDGYAPYDALASLYIRTGRYKEALTIIDNGLRRNPTDGTLRSLRTIAEQGIDSGGPR